MSIALSNFLLKFIFRFDVTQSVCDLHNYVTLPNFDPTQHPLKSCVPLFHSGIIPKILDTSIIIMFYDNFILDDIAKVKNKRDAFLLGRYVATQMNQSVKRKMQYPTEFPAKAANNNKRSRESYEKVIHQLLDFHNN